MAKYQATLIFLVMVIVVISANVLSKLETTKTPTIESNLNGSEPILNRNRRDCACMTTTNRCVSEGNYQCWFENGASIVQCVFGKWKLVSKCSDETTCRTLHNDRPYCL